MSRRNFPCTRSGVSVNVTTSSQTISLGSDTTTVQAAPDVLVDNRGSADCYVKAGIAGVSATSNDMRVPAGEGVVFDKGQSTHVGIVGAGATAVVLFIGEGG